MSNITDELSIEANSVDPEQTAPDLGPHCLQLTLLKHFNRREKQTTFVAIGVLRVNARIKKVSSVGFPKFRQLFCQNEREGSVPV